MYLNRRHFLKGTAAAGIAFNAIPLLGAGPERKYRTALIGSGWWGKNILKEAMDSNDKSRQPAGVGFPEVEVEAEDEIVAVFAEEDEWAFLLPEEHAI